MQKNNPQKEIRQKQGQDLPGSEKEMDPQPKYDNPELKGNGKLKD